MRSGVFVAMPVYRGMAFIEETIRSILAQTYRDFHLVMSVDGADDPTIELCRKYSMEPRVDVIVQEQRLGWPGNLNFLIRRCDREFFCYWQQDDIASTDYLETLLKELSVRPDAAIAHTDVQWFGAAYHRDSTPSIEGDALARVMQHIEGIRFEPLRGVMRSGLFPRDLDPIPVTLDESQQEEFVFLARMVAAGAFIRSPRAMYFKRLHNENAFARWRHFPNWRRRRGWISMGLGMYRTALSVAPTHLNARILAQLLDRLSIYRAGRNFFYEVEQTSSEIVRFVRDFVATGELSPFELEFADDDSPTGMSRPVHPDVLRALAVEGEHYQSRQSVMDLLRTDGHFSLGAGADGAACLLGYGWSTPEPWGVWTDGEHAALRIPLPSESAWRVRIEGRVNALDGLVSIGVGTNRDDLSYSSFDSDQPVDISFEVAPTRSVITLHLPGAQSPAEYGLSSDTRALCLGLTRVSIQLA